MIQQITGVETSKKGNKYATNLAGENLVAATKIIGEKLVPGAWVNVVERINTKTRNEAGELVDIPEKDRTKILVVTAVFADKKAAILAQAEPKMFDQLVDAYVASETKKISSEEFNLEKALATV